MPGDQNNTIEIMDEMYPSEDMDLLAIQNKNPANESLFQLIHINRLGVNIKHLQNL
jgi:hypothetical protein